MKTHYMKAIRATMLWSCSDSTFVPRDFFCIERVLCKEDTPNCDFVGLVLR